MNKAIEPSRRLGRFTASSSLARQFSTSLKRVMGQCIIVHAEQMFANDEIQYCAISEHFAPLPNGEIVPQYRWVFSETDGLRAERVEHAPPP